MDSVKRGRPGYEGRRRASVWQLIVPERYPEAIVTVSNREEARSVVVGARRDGRRLSVRSGGHSYIGSALRDDVVLIDFGAIAHVEVDPGRLTARVGPGATNGELDRALEAAGLAFPVGHSPSVGVGGYLLGGGLGWNPDGWGVACGRVRGATVLLADGDIVRVDEDTHPDLLFALRGGGPHFPGLVVEYELELVRRPRRITELSYRFPDEQLEAVTAWAEAVLEGRHPDVEGSITLTREEGRVVATASAVAFADDADSATAMLEPLARVLPSSAVTRHRRLSQLLADNDEPLARYAVDGFWARHPATVLGPCIDAVRSAPKGGPLVHVSIRTRPAVRADMAMSLAAPVFVFASTAWSEPSDDAAQLGWQDALIRSADPAPIGHYVNECDYLRRPERLAACFTPAARERLREVVRRYDPEHAVALPAP